MAVLNPCIFRKNQVVCSSTGPKILAFGSHSSAKFQSILDCFIPNFKLKYEDSENIKADRVNIVVFNLHQIQRRAFFFWDTRQFKTHCTYKGVSKLEQYMNNIKQWKQ